MVLEWQVAIIIVIVAAPCRAGAAGVLRGLASIPTNIAKRWRTRSLDLTPGALKTPRTMRGSEL
jgi:hypothetical protein